MRVLTFTESAHQLGAHSRHKEIAAALVNAGHQVVWLGPSSADVARVGGLEFVQLRARWLLRLSLIGYFLCFLFNLIRIAKQSDRFDVVFVVRERELLVLWIFKILNYCPRLIFFQRADAIGLLRFSLQNEVAWLKKLKLAGKYCFWRIGAHWLYRIPEKIVVQTPNHVSSIVSVSSRLSDRLIIVPNSVTASWMRRQNRDVRTLTSVPETSRVIGSVGNIYMCGKGLDLLLNAFQLVSLEADVVLVVFGDGPDRDRLTALAGRLGIADRVRMLGQVDGAARFMPTLDVLAHLSRVDGCPNVVLEGLVSGVPLVATRIPAHQFLLGENFSGLADLSSLAVADLIVAILKDPMFREKLCIEQAQRLKMFDFDWDSEIVSILGGEYERRAHGPASGLCDR